MKVELIMQQENKIEYKKRFVSKRQNMWNYIRRNRQFRIGDVMMVCDVNYDYMQKFLKFLENASYINLKNEKKPYSSRVYVLLKNSGLYLVDLLHHLHYSVLWLLRLRQVPVQ